MFEARLGRFPLGDCGTAACEAEGHCACAASVEKETATASTTSERNFMVSSVDAERADALTFYGERSEFLSPRRLASHGPAEAGAPLTFGDAPAQVEDRHSCLSSKRLARERTGRIACPPRSSQLVQRFLVSPRRLHMDLACK